MDNDLFEMNSAQYYLCSGISMKPSGSQYLVICILPMYKIVLIFRSYYIENLIFCIIKRNLSKIQAFK